MILTKQEAQVLVGFLDKTPLVGSTEAINMVHLITKLGQFINSPEIVNSKEDIQNATKSSN